VKYTLRSSYTRGSMLTDLPVSFFICMTLFGQSLKFRTQAPLRFELFIEHMQVFLDQSDHLLVKFFGKIAQAEPVCGQIIIIVAVSNVCNISTFINEQTYVLKY
jgi:hypothetical protein